MTAPERVDTFEDLVAATERLKATVSGLDESDVRGPSLLPGWTRAHVLTHIARNADGARALLLAVRSGEAVPMYPSPEARQADIDVGATRPWAVIVEDVLESSRRYVIDARCMPEGSPEAPTLLCLRMRRREVEFHHVDLNARYTFANTPEPLAAAFLDDTVERLKSQDFAHSASGPTHALLAWLTGRSDGRDLVVPTGEQLPAVPSLG